MNKPRITLIVIAFIGAVVGGGAAALVAYLLGLLR